MNLFEHLSRGLELRALRLEEEAKKIRKTLKNLRDFCISAAEDEETIGGLPKGWGITLVRSENTFFIALAICLNGEKQIFQNIPIVQKANSEGQPDSKGPHRTRFETEPLSYPGQLPFPKQQIHQLIEMGWELVPSTNSGGWRKIAEGEFEWESDGILVKKMDGATYDSLAFHFV